MKIILLATWPNGQTQHIYSTSSRLVAKSQHNSKLNRHVIEVTGPDAKFLSECIWNSKSMSQAIPMVVDESYNPIPLGSELGPAYSYDDKGNQIVSGLAFIRADEMKGAEVVIKSANEPNQKEAMPPIESIRQVVPEPRELPALPEQQAPKADAQGDVTVDDEEDQEADMPIEELICKRIASYGKLRVETLAANLGVTSKDVNDAVAKCSLLKITGTKKNATVSAK